eukprot:6212617-Alexandrium_andersonii.AAC.1
MLHAFLQRRRRGDVARLTRVGKNLLCFKAGGLLSREKPTSVDSRRSGASDLAHAGAGHALAAA